jgi:Flp pilus assembly protein TadG
MGTPMQRVARRQGATAVEAGLVLSVTLLMLFGIFEYCRFVLLVQVMENAARDGARYAVARTGDGTTLTDVQNYVTDRMAGRDAEVAGCTIDVQNVYPDTGLPVPGTVWSDAPFGGAIMVKISGTYSPMLPTFLKAQTSIPVKAASMMTSEAN